MWLDVGTDGACVWIIGKLVVRGKNLVFDERVDVRVNLLCLTLALGARLLRLAFVMAVQRIHVEAIWPKNHKQIHGN